VRFRYFALAAFAPLCAPTQSAVAQSVAPPTRDELDRGNVDQTDARSPARLSVEGDIERAPCPLADPRFADVRVTFSKVAFSNLKGVDATELDSSWREFAGRSVPVATLCEVRDRAATYLRKQGFLAAVQVVPQRIAENGEVSFDVLMAKLVAIQVRGDAGPSESKIAHYLESLTDKPVFNSREAERYLLLARDLPGYDVRLTMRPAGTVPGEVIGEVSVTHQRLQISANFQNLGSRDTGRWGGLIRAQINGLTGLGDSTTVSVFNTVQHREQTILQGGHSFLIGNEGLRLSGDVTYAWSKPTLIPAAPIKSETLLAALSASYPLIRLQSRNMVAATGLELVDQDVVFGGVPLTRDRMRVGFARLTYDQIDPRSLSSTKGYSLLEPKWRYGGFVEFRHGIAAFGASKPCGAGFANCLAPFTPLSRIEGDPTAFVARGSVYAEFRPLANIGVTLTTRGQYSAKPLLSFEEFSAGTYTVGRGYDSGTLLGDSGLGVQAEARIGSLQPRKPESISVQPYAFFDLARVWNKDRSNPPYTPGRASLMSAGGGVRVAWGNHARLDVSLAAPLSRAGLLASRPGPRLLISLTTQLLPWSR
jgi:hemolysin activation/secretion protein